jgi:hypothetical protein
MGATADWMRGQRRPRPRGGWRKVRWDRIAILVVIVALAVAFWWTLLSIVLHRLVTSSF